MEITYFDFMIHETNNTEIGQRQLPHTHLTETSGELVKKTLLANI